MEEIVVEPSVETLKPKEASIPEVTVKADTQPAALPSFVGPVTTNVTPATPAAPTSSNKPVPTPLTTDTTVTAVKVVTRTVDVFNKGAWKTNKEEEDEDELEIPEIDMGFDSDEE